MVSINSLWIAIDIDVNGSIATKEKHPFYQFIEYSFFTYFLGEVLIRFAAFRHKRDCFRDFWFNFDSTLVISTHCVAHNLLLQGAWGGE